MKTLFIFFSLLISFNYLFAQCDDCKDITKEYDSFDDKNIITVDVGKLSGSNIFKEVAK